MRLRARNPRRVLLTAGRSDSPLPRPDHVSEATMPKIAGLAIRDKPLASLLLAAVEQGFRLEPATNGGHPNGSGLVAYPPDTTRAPVRFGIDRISPKHVANIRTQLRLAGFTDEEQATTAEEHDDMGRSRTTTAISDTLSDKPTIITKAVRYEEAERTMQEALRKGGIPEEVIALTQILQHAALDWSVAAQRVVSSVDQQEVDEALALAAEAEKRATFLESRVASLEAAVDKARADCGAALERAKVAEGRAEAADAALRPLRAFLATGQ